MTWSESDDPLDKAQSATSENSAVVLSMLLSRWMRANGDQFDQRSTYLALGAGQGIGELEFARRIGIAVDPNHVTFLDKNLPPETDITRQSRRGVRETMSSFLFKPPTTRYDVVTALSMDYVIDEQSIGSVLEALEPHLNMGAYILITPYMGAEIVRPGFRYHNPYPRTPQGIRPIIYKYIGRP